MYNSNDKRFGRNKLKTYEHSIHWAYSSDTQITTNQVYATLHIQIEIKHVNVCLQEDALGQRPRAGRKDFHSSTV